MHSHYRLLQFPYKMTRFTTDTDWRGIIIGCGVCLPLCLGHEYVGKSNRSRRGWLLRGLEKVMPWARIEFKPQIASNNEGQITEKYIVITIWIQVLWLLLQHDVPITAVENGENDQRKRMKMIGIA